jgi:Mg2+/Co2+ transporter CorC
MEKDLILKYLSEGKTQCEISELLKASNITPNSLSHIEKTLKEIRQQYNAKTIFHLAVILCKNNLL